MGTKTREGVGMITRKKRAIQEIEIENYIQENMKKGRMDSMEINSTTDSNVQGNRINIHCNGGGWKLAPPRTMKIIS